MTLREGSEVLRNDSLEFIDPRIYLPPSLNSTPVYSLYDTKSDAFPLSDWRTQRKYETDYFAHPLTNVRIDVAELPNLIGKAKSQPGEQIYFLSLTPTGEKLTFVEATQSRKKRRKPFHTGVPGFIGPFTNNENLEIEGGQHLIGIRITVTDQALKKSLLFGNESPKFINHIGLTSSDFKSTDPQNQAEPKKIWFTRGFVPGLIKPDGFNRLVHIGLGYSQNGYTEPNFLTMGRGGQIIIPIPTIEQPRPKIILNHLQDSSPSQTEVLGPYQAGGINPEFVFNHPYLSYRHKKEIIPGTTFLIVNLIPTDRHYHKEPIT